MSDPYAALDATAQADVVRSGDATPSDLVDAAIARIERLDAELHAVIVECFDDARSAAARSLPDGPFRGVPILIKDLGAGQVDGLPYHLGNRALREANHRQRGDSFVVRRLRRAGFVMLGKTNTPELGFSNTTEPDILPATSNPWDTARSPSGSSGGSAAAVASGMVPVATASDGGGSIRTPASVTGLVGLKPSRGRVSSGPFTGESGAGRSVEFALTRTVRDAAALLDVLAGAEPGDPVVAPPPLRPFSEDVGADPGRLRIGIHTAPFAPDAHPDADVVGAVEDAGRLLESLGHDLDAAVPDALVGEGEQTTGILGILTLHGASMAAAADHISHLIGHEVGPQDFEEKTWEQIEFGRAFTAAQFVQAREDVTAWSRAVNSWWSTTGDHDLLLMPTSGSPAPKLGELRFDPDDPSGSQERAVRFSQYTPAANWAGLPAVSVPLGTSSDELPIGVQLVGAYGREDLLVRVAAQLEDASPWSARRPGVHA